MEQFIKTESELSLSISKGKLIVKDTPEKYKNLKLSNFVCIDLLEYANHIIDKRITENISEEFLLLSEFNLTEDGLINYYRFIIPNLEKTLLEESVPESTVVYYNGECYFNPANKIDEQVLWETENVKITAKQFTHDGEYDSYADLELLIENKTDKEFTLTESNTSVNEYMVNPSLYAVIPAGKTLSDSLAFEVDDMDAAYKKHSEMGCICYDNKEMGVYFIVDPDGYWIEIVPAE